MERQDKIGMIVRKINILDLCKREHIIKILLAYSIDVNQSNNGAWCKTEALSDKVIEVVYDYLLLSLK